MFSSYCKCKYVLLRQGVVQLKYLYAGHVYSWGAEQVSGILPWFKPSDNETGTVELLYLVFGWRSCPELVNHLAVYVPLSFLSH